MYDHLSFIREFPIELVNLSLYICSQSQVRNLKEKIKERKWEELKKELWKKVASVGMEMMRPIQKDEDNLEKTESHGLFLAVRVMRLPLLKPSGTTSLACKGR